MQVLFESEGKLDCHTCDETLRKERGHDTEGIIPYWIDGRFVKRCPLTFITPLSWEYIKAFGFYEKNLLPNGNSWIMESNRYIQAMCIIDNELNKIKKANTKEQRKNAGNRP